MPWSYITPLVAALFYATAVLLVKRASDLGVGVWQTVFVSNVVCAFFFQPLLLLGGEIHPVLLWQPALVAGCFIAGQWLTYLSLQQGDVSVATPVLGIKIILVALFVMLIGGEQLGGQLWAAAALATIGLALLNRRHATAHHDVGWTIVTASLAAASFALFDVLVQKWSPAWGLGRFLPLTIGAAGVLSLGFVLKLKTPLSAISREAWPWLIAGTLAMGVQALVFVTTIAYWGQAAAANVIYNSRGLISVLMVWSLGHLVSSREQSLGGAVLGWRLAGATLMLVAIALVLV